MFQPRTLILTLLLVVAAFGLSWHFFTKPLRPWPDQGWVLQAAVRHARGQGLTSQMNGNSDDLTEVTYTRLVYFPPLYPLLVSECVRIGLPLETGVKAINGVALILGVWGWMGLAMRWLKHFSTQLLFAGLLLVAGSALVPKGATADYLFWAATPFWVALLLAARSSTKSLGQVLAVGFSAILVSLLIGVRWAAAALVPLGVLLLLLPGPVGQGWLPRLLLTGLYGAVPTATYFLIGAVNRHYSDSGANTLSFITPQWQPHLLLTLYPIECVFTMPLGLEPLLKRIWRAWDPALQSPWLGALFRIVLPLPLFAWLLLCLRRETKGSQGNELRLVLGVMIVGTIAFLAVMTARYNWDFVAWSYLDEPRYFRPIWPAAALFWLTLFDEVRARLARSIGTGLLALCVVYLLQAQVRWEHQHLTEPEESWELVQKVRSLEQRAGLQIIVDNDVSDYILTAGPNLLAIGYPEPNDVSKLTVRRSADLWLVRRVNQKTAYVLDPGYDATRFNALMNRFRPERIWTSSGENFELYHARIGP